MIFLLLRLVSLVKFFPSSPLVWWYPFSVLQVLLVLILSKHFGSFLVLQYCSFRCLSFPLFIISMAHLSMPNLIPTYRLYILIVCIKAFGSFSFFCPYYFWDFFHESLSDNKSPQVSRALLSILVDLSNALVWIVSTRLLISKSFSPFTNPLVTVRRIPFTIGITVTFMFHSFFQFPRKVEVLILLAFFQFYTGQSGQQSPRFFLFWEFFTTAFTGIWVTASLLKSSGLFSVFWLIIIIIINIIISLRVIHISIGWWSFYYFY